MHDVQKRLSFGLTVYRLASFLRKNQLRGITLRVTVNQQNPLLQVVSQMGCDVTRESRLSDPSLVIEE